MSIDFNEFCLLRFPLGSEASLVINCYAFLLLAVLLGELLPPSVTKWDQCSSMALPLRVQTQMEFLSQVVFPIVLQTWEEENKALRLNDAFPIQ